MQTIPSPLVKCLLLSLGFAAAMACNTGAAAEAMTAVPSLMETAQPQEDVCAWPGQAGSFSAGLQADDDLTAPCGAGLQSAQAVPDDMPTTVPQAPSYLLILSGCGALLLKRRKLVRAEPWAPQPI
jgi:hypothetical protein